jgi:hypothetical protein
MYHRNTPRARPHAPLGVTAIPGRGQHEPLANKTGTEGNGRPPRPFARHEHRSSRRADAGHLPVRRHPCRQPPLSIDRSKPPHFSLYRRTSSSIRHEQSPPSLDDGHRHGAGSVAAGRLRGGTIAGVQYPRAPAAGHGLCDRPPARQLVPRPAPCARQQPSRVLLGRKGLIGRMSDCRLLAALGRRRARGNKSARRRCNVRSPAPSGRGRPVLPRARHRAHSSGPRDLLKQPLQATFWPLCSRCPGNSGKP